MLRVTAILGNAADPSVAPRLASLDRAGGLETLILGRGDMSRRRLHGVTDLGTEIALMLDRDAVLDDGAVLWLDARRAIVARLEAGRWLSIRAAGTAQALELGYFAGSMHWKVRFDGATLRIAMNGPREHYLARLAPLLERDAVEVGEDEVSSARPADVPVHDHEPDASGHGHGHGSVEGHAHDHGHDHDHDHGHGHGRRHGPRRPSTRDAA